LPPSFRLIPFLLAAAPAYAECLPEYVRELEPFPVYDALGPVPHAWYGGWQTPRPQLVDIDADGDLDLFVAEELGQIRFYRNDGTPSSASFVFVTDDFAGVHELYFMRFADVDTDGDFDLLVEAPPFGGPTQERTGAYLYTNVGGPEVPQWMNLSTHPDGYFTDATGEPIPFVTTAPDFVDLEGDGDVDLLYGDASGSVVLYRNQAARGGSSFVFETDAYGGIVIRPGECNPEGARSAPPLRAPELRHGFMLFSFHDVDGDERPDMFVGDQFNSNVYYWGNAGGFPSPAFTCRTERFFADTTGAAGVFPQFLVPAFGDLDGDGDPDAVLGPGTASVEDRLWFFVNAGTPTSPSLVMQTGGFLPELDYGRSSAAAFADLNGDSAPDLVLATGTSWQVSYFENVGSPALAEFGLVAPAWIPIPGASWAAPELADLDDDGDLDVTVGLASGGIRLWRNDGGGADAAGLVEIQDDDFGDSSQPGGRTFRSNVDGQAVPRFFDEDGDGDLDCLVGRWGSNGEARLLLFRNDGTPEAHDFVLASSDYQGLGVLGMNLAPALGDVDDDGDVDLLVGKLDGTIEFFRNRGRPGAPAFESEVARLGDIDVGRSAVPFLVDLDGDGDLDLVAGESGGGLNFYRNASGPEPPAVGLVAPAVDASVPGRDPVQFSWDAVPGTSRGEITYDLLLAAAPPPDHEPWVVRSGLDAPETTVQVFFEGLRFQEDFWWAVVARNGCNAGPASEWRHAVHVGFIDDDLVGQPFPGPPAEVRGEVAVQTRLTGVFPSPTTGSAEISYVLRRPGPVRVDVYDLAGRRVAVLEAGRRERGEHRVRWDGRTARGLAAPGIYLVRLQTEDGTESRRIVRLR